MYNLPRSSLDAGWQQGYSCLVPMPVSFSFEWQVYRAKERLDHDFKERGIDIDATEKAAGTAQEAADTAEQGRQR